MIVYNAGRRFFSMKVDAEAHRRTLGLAKDHLHKIEIVDREGLAEFLNALCDREPLPALGGDVPPIQVADDACNFIPDFVRRDWLRRAELRRA